MLASSDMWTMISFQKGVQYFIKLKYKEVNDKIVNWKKPNNLLKK